MDVQRRQTALPHPGSKENGMSAIMLHPVHVAALVDAAISRDGVSGPMSHDFGPGARNPGCRPCTHEDADYLGRILTETMQRSVSHHYRETKAKNGKTGYSHAAASAALRGRARLSEIKIGRALACYEYQTCEAPEWKGSEAERFGDELRAHLLRRLGHECELWAITPEELGSAARQANALHG